MPLNQILTRRQFDRASFLSIVYEWEEDLAAALQVDLAPAFQDRNVWIKSLELLCQPLAWLLETRRRAFVFEIGVERSPSRNKPNVIPCIIDFWLRGGWKMLLFRYLTFRNPLVLITSREAYEHLVSCGWGKRIRHFPLSISDRYRIKSETRFEKKYDLMVVGRQNPVLKGFLDRYAAEHADFRYVRRVVENGIARYRLSDGSPAVGGGEGDGREQYMAYMRLSRAILYSTPGIDASRGTANGFNQVTPRFLEGIACGCHILARYTDNPDTRFYEVSKIAPHIDSYEMFARLLDKARTELVDMDKYAHYLERHYTSTRTGLLKEIVAEAWK